MKTVSLEEFKNNLSEYIEKIQNGKDITMGEMKKNIFRILPYKGENEKRKLGPLDGKASAVF